jgi:hypothetical protein
MMENLKELPNTGFAPSNESIAKHLREQADWIEEDDDPIRNIFIIIEHTDGTLRRQICGQPCDLARAVGVMTIACVRASTVDE